MGGQCASLFCSRAGPRASTGVLCASLVLLIAACGEDDVGLKKHDAASNAENHARDAGDGDQQGDGGAHDESDGDRFRVETPDNGCSSTENCAAGQVCHPTLHSCVTPGSACSAHSDCTARTYCENTLGLCLPATNGSPCASDANCDGVCRAGTCGCDGLVTEQRLTSKPLDVYLILDRTGSMGADCVYQHGGTPPVDSKACFATYALSDYLIDVAPRVDTRLAFHFMSQKKDCDGTPYTTPLSGLTSLPLAADHPLIKAISDEDFKGGLGTHIEGALRGLARYTSTNKTPDREMIGVLLTDGDPEGCEENLTVLRTIVADHLAATGIRTFILGMEGATEENLEELALAGGADPHSEWCGKMRAPCHYWNVGNGSGDAIASALQAIINMSVPLPCHFNVLDLKAPPDKTLDFSKVNVTLASEGSTTIIGQVPMEPACPADKAAWYYDAPQAPTQIHLCPKACDLVSSAENGARVHVVVGCDRTLKLF